MMKLIFPIILLLVGLLFFWFSRAKIKLGLASSSWPEVVAVVTKSEFKLSGPRSSAEPAIEMEYQYQVENVPYVGTRAGFGPITGSDMQEIPEVGEEIKIRYAPDDHSQSVFIPGLTRSTKTMAIISIVLIVVGIGTGGNVLRLMFKDKQ